MVRSGAVVTEATAYGITFLIYLLVCLLLMRGWRRGRYGLALAGGAALAAVWAFVGFLSAMSLPLPVALTGIAELARTGGWLLVALTALHLATAGRAEPMRASEPLLLAVLGLTVGGVLTLLASVQLGWNAHAAWTANAGVRLSLAIVGLLLVENLFHATRGDARWSFKHLVIALGGIFAYDLFLYSEALLFRQESWATEAARPLANAVVAPLVLVAAVRIRQLELDVTISRKVVLQTSALVGSGIYLLGVAGIGYILRESALAWGPLLQIAVFSGALVLLAAVLLSGQVQARAKLLISRNFFSFAYDYRQEWRRFIHTMSSTGAAPAGRSERAVRAIADVLDSTGGALFLRGPDGVYALDATWSWPGAKDLVTLPPPLAALLQGDGVVIDLHDHRQQRTTRRDCPTAGDGRLLDEAWRSRLGQPWLLVPLRSRDEIVGVILLGESRAPHRLTWEDIDLIEILSLQLGSYLAEEKIARDLAEARRFESISRNFTFVAHDLKNLVSQLSLIVQQAERHGENPAFQRDALATVGDSVSKMRGMLVRLKKAAEPEERESIDLTSLVRDLVIADAAGTTAVELVSDENAVVVAADREGLRSVIGNLIQNAHEAGGPVRVRTGRAGSEAIVEVQDHGPGMSEELARRALFEPFLSTKAGGYGIGLYQSRSVVERWGGAVEIDGGLGIGTTARIRLPIDGAKPVSRSEGTSRLDPEAACS